MKTRLKKSYIKVQSAEGKTFYGRSQKWFENKKIHDFGCGAVAAHDVTEYLLEGSEISSGEEHKEILTEEIYKKLLADYRKRYVPLMPYFGTVGWVLSRGMNHGFRSCNLNYRASWGVRPERLFRVMEKMLSQDIPVIWSIGPNTPPSKAKYMLALYVKNADGTFTNLEACQAHFVVATAMNDEWVQVSSWGKRYYINIEEYKNYVHYHSNWAGSNIMVIKKKNHRS